MGAPLIRLYPAPGGEVTLDGLYLEHRLHKRGQAGEPFLYSNFVTSLDGRIAVAAAGRATHTVPDAIANPRDWRLYQELAGQADILITSGRFFRQSVAGEAQDWLPVSTASAYSDIHAWRKAQGLTRQPDIAIMSGSLDLPLASLQPYQDQQRRIFAVTGAQADAKRCAALENAGITVIHAGRGNQVDGKAMIAQLAGHDYRSMYAIAGPSVFYTLLSAGVVNRLYLTIAQQLLGGEDIDTLTRGPLLEPARGMQLVSLYHDAHAPAGTGQLFCVFAAASVRHDHADPG
ncbi:MAG: dihydrofolate reductase family protein [Gammaproteobacteria bacterium]